jgi:NADPH-dependent glutamate synthase beta subunit-like oxidoreductase/coenzyme F420-reducing hydrogenase delta subunit
MYLNLVHTPLAEDIMNIDRKTSSCVEPALRQYLAPCQVRCPIHEDIQRTNVLISLLPLDPEKAKVKLLEIGDYIYDRNPFFTVCGYVCGLCELECNYSTHGGSIRRRLLKRFVADVYGDRLNKREPFPWSSGREPVAVIGGGPAGLMAAYELRRRGYRPTVFEASDQLGGALRLIPHYRLPDAILTSALDNLVRLAGIDVRLNTIIGQPGKTLADIERDGFRAIFIAKGSPAPRILTFDNEKVANQDLLGVIYGHSFLYEVGHNHICEDHFKGKRVLVIGGGNVALDAARTAVQLGAEVELVCLESADHESRDGIPADQAEVRAACQEGVIIYYSRGVQRIQGENGRFMAIDSPRCIQVFNDKGFHPRFDLNDTLTLAADLLIIAVGQEAERDFLSREGLLDQRGRVAVDPVTLQSLTREDVFIGGDLRQIGFMADAMRDGLTAAESMERFLCNQDLREGRSVELVMQATPLRHEYRHEPDLVWIPPEERLHFRLFENGFTHSEAIAEARRCMTCGPCLSCKACMAQGLQEELPTLALHEEACSGCGICSATCRYGAAQIALKEGKLRSMTDSFACKGCGACVTACPAGARSLANDLYCTRFSQVMADLKNKRVGETPQVVCFSCLFSWGYLTDREETAKRVANWIPVVCSGKIEGSQILRAFAEGADGVLILGCRRGECHFQDGNLQTMKRVETLKMVLAAFRIDPERLEARFSIDPEADSLPELLAEFRERVSCLETKAEHNEADGSPK